MTWDLTTAKLRLNITDGSQDAEIEAALDASLAVAEAYCKRRFKYASVTEQAVYDGGGRLFLERYPIDPAVPLHITGTNYTLSKFEVNDRAGILEFAGQLAHGSVTIDYSGGYIVLPDDLIVALFAIFDGIWAAGQGSSGPTAGAIESVSLTGVGTVRMSTGASASTSASSGAIPAMALAILSNYKRYLA